MSEASAHLADAIVKSALRGAAFPVPTAVYVALHVGNPGANGANEVTTAQWPAYAREDTAKGGLLTDAWTDPAGTGLSMNKLQILFPIYDGSSELNITHYSLWDAETGGNMLGRTALDTTRSLKPDDVFVFNPNKMEFQVAK